MLPLQINTNLVLIHSWSHSFHYFYYIFPVLEFLFGSLKISVVLFLIVSSSLSNFLIFDFFFLLELSGQGYSSLMIPVSGVLQIFFYCVLFLMVLCMSSCPFIFLRIFWLCTEHYVWRGKIEAYCDVISLREDKGLLLPGTWQTGTILIQFQGLWWFKALGIRLVHA